MNISNGNIHFGEQAKALIDEFAKGSSISSQLQDKVSLHVGRIYTSINSENIDRSALKKEIEELKKAFDSVVPQLTHYKQTVRGDADATVRQFQQLVVQINIDVNSKISPDQQDIEILCGAFVDVATSIMNVAGSCLSSCFSWGSSFLTADSDEGSTRSLPSPSPIQESEMVTPEDVQKELSSFISEINEKIADPGIVEYWKEDTLKSTLAPFKAETFMEKPTFTAYMESTIETSLKANQIGEPAIPLVQSLAAKFIKNMHDNAEIIDLEANRLKIGTSLNYAISTVILSINGMKTGVQFMNAFPSKGEPADFDKLDSLKHISQNDLKNLKDDILFLYREKGEDFTAIEKVYKRAINNRTTWEELKNLVDEKVSPHRATQFLHRLVPDSKDLTEFKEMVNKKIANHIAVLITERKQTPTPATTEVGFSIVRSIRRKIRQLFNLFTKKTTEAAISQIKPATLAHWALPKNQGENIQNVFEWLNVDFTGIRMNDAMAEVAFYYLLEKITEEMATIVNEAPSPQVTGEGVANQPPSPATVELFQRSQAHLKEVLVEASPTSKGIAGYAMNVVKDAAIATQGTGGLLDVITPVFQNLGESWISWLQS